MSKPLTDAERNVVSTNLIPKAEREGLEKLTVPQLKDIIKFYSIPNIPLASNKPVLLEKIYPYLTDVKNINLPPLRNDPKSYSSVSPGPVEDTLKCLNKYNIPENIKDIGIMSRDCLLDLGRDCRLTLPVGRRHKEDVENILAPQIAQIYGIENPLPLNQNDAIPRRPCKLPEGISVPRAQPTLAPRAQPSPSPRAPYQSPYETRQAQPTPLPQGQPQRKGQPLQMSAAETRQKGIVPPPRFSLAPGLRAAQPMQRLPPYRSLGYQVTQQNIYPPQIQREQRTPVDQNLIRTIEQLNPVNAANMLSKLSYQDLIRLCQSSQKLNYICSDQNIWTSRLTREFSGVRVPKNVQVRDLYQYVRFLKDRKAKVHIIDREQFPYTYDDFYDQTRAYFEEQGQTLSPEDEDKIGVEYADYLLKSANSLIGNLPDLRRGDILEFETGTSDEDKFIYDGKTFQRLGKFNEIPRDFPVIDEFPITYWSESVQSPLVYFNAKPYVKDILQNRAGGPGNLFSKFQHKNGIPIQIYIIAESPTNRELQQALENGQFSHAAGKVNPDDEWRTLVLEM